MYNNIKIINYNNSFDIHIYYDNTEFSKELYNNDFKNIKLKKSIKNKTIRNIKIFVSGILVISIPFSLLTLEQKENLNILPIEDVDNDNYENINYENYSSSINLGYVYIGNTITQLEYITRTNFINTASPSYFDIDSSGNLIINNIDKNFIDNLHQNNIRVVPFLSNHWNREAGILALNNLEQLSNQLAYYIEEYNLDGINIDIENVTHNEKEKYVLFIKKLREKIPLEKEISVAVAANPYSYTQGWHGSYDYTNLAKYADYLMIMSYDEHYAGSLSGPVSSYDFFEKSLKYALNKTTKDKIVMGYGLYGRLWSTNNNLIQGISLTDNTITKIKNIYNYTYTFDLNTKSPKLEFEIKYTDDNITIGNTTLLPGKYVIWYEDIHSINEKKMLVEKYQIKGHGFWCLGQENISIWDAFL